jgi:pentatricopeptide repeat protein
MIESGLSPDLNTFGAFMDGYARCGDVDGARALYATMTGRSESSRDGVWRVKDEDGDLIDFTADGSRDGSGTAKSSSSSPGVEVTTPPDARVRLALVTACARAGLTSAAEEVLTMIESDLASSSAGDDSAREMTELRERFRRELASSRVADGRTVARRVARRTKGRGGNGIARIKAADPRAGCPVPSSWGPAPRERRKRSAASSSSPIGSSIDVQVSRPSVDEEDTEWSRGLEMWKHWLGLPSRYYDGKGASAKGQIQAATSKQPSESSASMNAMDPMETKAVPYTKGEIADAVRVLREAAAKRYPDDPDRALTLALEAAEDGDAARVLSRDEANATRDEDFSGDADGIDVA